MCNLKAFYLNFKTKLLSQYKTYEAFSKKLIKLIEEINSEFYLIFNLTKHFIRISNMMKFISP